MSFKALTLDEFCSALAARAPVPGGGAVAAVTAAHAAALLSMVLEFTLGKPAHAAHEAANRAALERTHAFRTRALELADADAQAYSALNALWKLPKDAPARTQAWPSAVQAAVDAPLAILALSAQIAGTAAELKNTTNPNLASDLSIALDLARVAARAAAHNVVVNLPGLADHAARDSASARMRAALAEAGAE